MTNAVSQRPARVMISISEPDRGELLSRGLDEVHLRHAFIEIARHVLAAGHSISYGGDLRPGGYTETIIDFLRTYRRQDLDARERFTSYVAWPAQQTLDGETLAELRTFSSPVLMERPMDAPEGEAIAADPSQSLGVARGYTEMRERIVDESDCVVVVGGRTYGQAGLIPGAQEEAYFALQKPIPLFVAGGYGGSAAAIGHALSGRVGEEFTTEYHLERTASYAQLLEDARGRGEQLSPEMVGGALLEIGWAGNLNHLSTEDDERLSVTDDVDEIIALLLRGIRQLSAG